MIRITSTLDLLIFFAALELCALNTLSQTAPRWPSGMKNALKQLLDTLDELFEEHEELGDTHVRESMAQAVHKAFIAPRTG